MNKHLIFFIIFMLFSSSAIIMEVIGLRKMDKGNSFFSLATYPLRKIAMLVWILMTLSYVALGYYK